MATAWGDLYDEIGAKREGMERKKGAKLERTKERKVRRSIV